MTAELVFALLSSACTATASVAQRAAAELAPGELSFSWRLLAFLVRRPVWFFGILCMVGGFGFQLAALRSGDLSLVEPVIASELLLVFGYLAFRHRGQVRRREWAAAVGMAVSLGGFLYLASPSGGTSAVGSPFPWAVAALVTTGIAVGAVGLSRVPLPGRQKPSPARRAAMLSIAVGATWGFGAAVTKQVAGQIGHGAGTVFTSWAVYVLVAIGAVGLFLVSNAFHAGPLAASQPGLTVVEPIVGSVLGVTMFGEHVQHAAGALAGELTLAVVLTASVVLLSRSPLIDVESPHAPAPGPGRVGADQSPRPTGPGRGAGTAPGRR